MIRARGKFYVKRKSFAISFHQHIESETLAIQCKFLITSAFLPDLPDGPRYKGMATLLSLRCCCSIEEATRSASEMKREGWDGSLSSSNIAFLPFLFPFHRIIVIRLRMHSLF